MQVRVAAICDFAQVREGLLSVLSAGITRIWRTQYPSPLGVMLALILEINPADAKTPSEVRLRIENADGIVLIETSTGIQLEAGPGHDPGEMLMLPVVVDFREFLIPETGRYQIVVNPMSEGVEPTVLAFRTGFPSDSGNPFQQ